MAVKVLKNGNSIALYVSKGKKIKHPLTWDDKLFFTLTEAKIPKTNQEKELEKKVKKFHKRVFLRGIKKDKSRLKESLERLKLEQMVRYFQIYQLYIGGYGELELADIDDFELNNGEISLIDYKFGKTKGRLKLYSGNCHEYIAIHGNNKLNLKKLT